MPWFLARKIVLFSIIQWLQMKCLRNAILRQSRILEGGGVQLSKFIGLKLGYVGLIYADLT